MAASMEAMSIFLMDIMASKTRFAEARRRCATFVSCGGSGIRAGSVTSIGGISGLATGLAGLVAV